MSSAVSRTFRYIRSFVPVAFATKEERINFVKYSNSENEKELSVFANGTVNSETNESSIPNGKITDPKFGEDEELSERRNKITEWQAGWNITNAIQGMFIVCFPYTVLQGGYWAILAMVLIAYICCHTGEILVECLYEPDQDGNIIRVRGSYVEIAEKVWGECFGGKIVICAQIIELLMTCILYVLLCGELIEGSFPDSPIDLSSWIMISTLFLLPCAFLQSLRSVSWLSFWCTVAHMAINAIILIYCCTKAAEWKWSDVQVRIDIWTFPISIGVVVFSYTSQIFVPTLEGNLVDKSKFKCMMHWTHFAAAIFKALFSYVGFLTWGNDTQEVITNNLPTQSFKIIVNLILVAKALLSYPLPFFASVDILETALFKDSGKTMLSSCVDKQFKLKPWALALRICLVLVTMLLAIFIPHFALLMGLIGSFTGTMLSFVWPCYFHMRLKWCGMKWYVKAWDITILTLGVLFGAIGIYYSGHALARALQGLPTRPYRNHVPLPHGD